MGKRIIFFTGGMGRGGAERVISLLAEKYKERGWNVAIAMVLHNIVEYDIPEGVELFSLSSKKGKIGIISTCKNIKNFVLEYRPSVIVSFLSPVCVLVDFAIGRKRQCPLIMSERIDPSMAKRNMLFSYIVKRAYSNSDWFIAQTRKAKEYFPLSIQKKTTIIPNPIKVVCEKTNKNQKRIVTAGRLTGQKNHLMLIDTFSKIHMHYPEYKLEIYGEGILKNVLETEIEKLKLEDVVFLKGTVSNLHEQIADADIFVLPSNYEGLSNAFLEAMLMGFPVISTDCAGANEYIVSGKNGIITKVGDTKDMFDAIKLLIDDSDLKRRLGFNAKISVEHVRVDNVINKWMSIIDKVVESF